MASVAAAIDEAAGPRHVDESLWWDDSFVYLLHNLETIYSAAPPNTEAVDGLLQNLREHHGWLLNLLAFFKLPNSNSRSAVNCPRIIIGKHNIEIKSELRDMALQLSSFLALDEVQMYILVSRSLKQETLVATDGIESFLETIAMRYFLERQCLLKCTRQILMYKFTAENAFFEYNAIREEANELLEQGLEDKTLVVFKDLLLAKRPSKLDLRYADLWAEETLIEESLIMDILFLLYYEPVRVCTADRWKSLLGVFKDIISGCSNIEKLAVTQEAQKYAQHVRYQAILVLIEALDLESLLYMVYDNVPFSQGSHAFSLEDLQEIDNSISVLNSLEDPESGLLIFTWAIFVCLVCMLPTTENQTTILEIDHLVYIRQAYDSGTPNIILEMLQSEAFQDFDAQGQVAGYKSVLKTLMAGFLAAYDFANQIEESTVKIFLDIICEIYSGQEILCSEFWDRESILDGPIRNLLFTLRDHFPYEILPMIQLLSSLCEGAWPSQCVYDFLYKMTKITTLFQSDGFSYENNDSKTVQAHISLQVPGAYGLIIPVGTIGHIMKMVNEDVILVRWESMHSGILVVLIRLMQELSSDQQYEEVVGSLELLCRMLSFNKALTLKLLELDGSPVVEMTRIYGCMEKTLRVDVINIICSLINNLVPISKDSKIPALCITVLCNFCDCSPSRVFTEIFKTVVFQPRTNTSNSDIWLLPKGLARLLSLDGDQSGGSYHFMISLLDLCKIFVAKGGKTELVMTLIIYIVRYVLVNHGNWKYKLRYERWQITSKIFELMRMGIICKMDQHSVQLRDILMETLLYDSTIHDVLLQVLCIRAESLEELYLNRLLHPREIEWLQQAVYSALDLVGVALNYVTGGEYLKDYAGTSTLDQSLLLTKSMPVPFVIAATSLLGFHRYGSLQLAAARVLSSLCVIAQKTRPHSISIESYLLSAKQRKYLSSVLSHLLSEESASSNVELFSAVMDLVTVAAVYQPSFVEVMLFPQEGTAEPTNSMQNNGIIRLGTSTSVGYGMKLERTIYKGVDALWRYLQKCEINMKRQPYILSQILHFLRTLWQGGTEYLHILDKFDGRDMFWKYISSCISVFSSSEFIPLTMMSDEEVTTKAFQYQCQSSVLHIMAHDIFLRRHLVQFEKTLVKPDASASTTVVTNTDQATRGKDNKAIMLKHARPSCAEKILLEWSNSSTMHKILQSYASCLYDKELILHAKAVARAFVVGLIGKVLSGDDAGLSLSLIEQIQLASKKIFEHPAFLELLGQYSTRGYSYGMELHALIVNDLYYHLQGELEGRKIPPGSFQRVSEYLIKLEIDSILQTDKQFRLKELHLLCEDKYIYDTKALETELGIEWWPHSDDKGFTAAAEKTLEILSRANKVSCLADLQLNALKAWMTVLALSIFDKKVGTEFRSITLNAAFSEESIGLCVEDLCKYLLTSMQLLGPLGDPTNYMLNFLITQAQLLLIFVRWMYSHIMSTTNRMQAWRLYAKVIRTVITTLRSLMDIKPFIPDGLETMLRCLLAVLLTSLELIHSQNKEYQANRESKTDKQNVDVFSDVSLMSLGFLPVLCSCVENNSVANLSLAVIDTLLKGFLAPNTWLPVFQKHFPTQCVIGRLRHDSWRDSAAVILNFCLSLARVRGGAEMLQSAGFFSCLSTFSHFLRDELSLGSGDREGPFSVWHKGRLSDGLWGLGLAVVTAMVNSLGENDAGVSVLENALTYFFSEKDYILCALYAPNLPTDALGRKRTKHQRPQTSLVALQETEHAVTLMCHLAKNRVTWLNVMQGVDSEFRETSIHLLAFIAKEGLICTRDNTRESMFLRCPPFQKEEIAAHEKPSLINSKNGWFAVSARGSMSKRRRWTPLQQSALDPGTNTVPLSLVKGEAESESITASFSEYSDLVALQVYRITFLVLNFLCMQAQAAIKRVEEAGNIDLVHFPELPVPEILHGLQDQAVVIMTELCSSRKQKHIEPQVQSVCLLLLRIMEKSLYLEVCVMRICGVSPVSVRLDDFSKEYKALISATQGQQFLEAPLKSLKRVLILLYPSLLT